jgi:hypothetical protein
VGAALSSYSPEGKNRRTIEDYLSSVEQFAHYVGMEWRGVEAVQAGDWSGEALTPAMRTDWIENFSRKLDVSM